MIERELRRLLRRVRQYSIDLAASVHPDLDPAVYGLLIDIYDSRTARAADLAEDRGVTKGVISRQVRGLEDLGLVERQLDPSDARAQILVVSATGRRAVKRTQTARHEALEQLLDASSPQELAAMAQAFANFNDLLE